MKKGIQYSEAVDKVIYGKDMDGINTEEEASALILAIVDQHLPKMYDRIAKILSE